MDRTIVVDTADGPMELYEALPGGDVHGAIIVVQEAFGVNDHIKHVTRRLAEVGYHAVAPSFFHRAGGGTGSYEDFATVLPLFEGLTDEGILGDTDAAVVHLHNAGFDDTQIGTVGFCFGGRVTFLIAAERALGAAVGFYGGGIVNARFPQFPALVDRAPTLKTPWLGLFGDLDTGIPIEDVETLRAALADAPVDGEIVRYADAEHGFHCDVRPAYNEAAAIDAWGRTLEWFASRLS